VVSRLRPAVFLKNLASVYKGPGIMWYLASAGSLPHFPDSGVDYLLDSGVVTHVTLGLVTSLSPVVITSSPPVLIASLTPVSLSPNFRF
jgi:hypothetical protein